MKAEEKTLFCVTFGNFWLTIQNTASRQVRNLFYLVAVFISFPLARAAAAAAVTAAWRCGAAGLQDRLRCRLLRICLCRRK
jgi:hypothetical protein